MVVWLTQGLMKDWRTIAWKRLWVISTFNYTASLWPAFGSLVSKLLLDILLHIFLPPIRDSSGGASWLSIDVNLFNELIFLDLSRYLLQEIEQSSKKNKYACHSRMKFKVRLVMDEKQERRWENQEHWTSWFFLLL